MKLYFKQKCLVEFEDLFFVDCLKNLNVELILSKNFEQKDVAALFNLIYKYDEKFNEKYNAKLRPLTDYLIEENFFEELKKKYNNNNIVVFALLNYLQHRAYCEIGDSNYPIRELDDLGVLGRICDKYYQIDLSNFIHCKKDLTDLINVFVILSRITKILMKILNKIDLYKNKEKFFLNKLIILNLKIIPANKIDAVLQNSKSLLNRVYYYNNNLVNNLMIDLMYYYFKTTSYDLNLFNLQLNYLIEQLKLIKI